MEEGIIYIGSSRPDGVRDMIQTWLKANPKFSIGNRYLLNNADVRSEVLVFVDYALPEEGE